MKRRAVIVDDERLGRQSLRRLLAAHPEIEVVGEADDAASAAALVRELDPDLLFLDVQMPGGSGFTVFERCQVRCQVIFVTAFDSYALRAFEVNALDYLLKPVSPERLAHALERLPARLSAASPPLARLTADDLLCLPVTQGLRFFRVREITWISAADDYSEVHLSGGADILTSTTMRSWEERLPDGFVRIHRSTIVNVDHIEAVTRAGQESWNVKLRSDPRPLSMSRRYGAAIQEKLGRLIR